MTDVQVEPGTAVAKPARGKRTIAAAPAATPLQLLDRALERGDDLTILEKLMDLQERHEKNEARKAFNHAVADARAEFKPVIKNRTGHNGKKYADMAAFADMADPILATHGLSYRFRFSQEEKIRVTCVLSHRDGHTEENSLEALPDTSGNKTAIHATGSTLTYLQRYTLSGALGLSAAEDDDGQAAGGADNEPITDEQLQTLRAMIDETDADTAKLCEYLKIDALPYLPKRRFGEAEATLKERARMQAEKKKKAGQQ